MERVAFLIEKTGERIGCMLNPETLIARRSAGIVRRNGYSGPLQGVRQTDDLLLYGGGGTTEMILDLLFDTTLSGDTAEPGDVRSLTRPLWNLAENGADDQGQAKVPIVRFVWGKTWNVPGLVTAVAERLEFFDESGVPRRSWLRMRFCRVHLDDQPADSVPAGPGLDSLLPLESPESGSTRASEEVTGGPQLQADNNNSTSRLDEIAFRNYGSSALWRLVAWFNNVADPLHVTAGTLLRIPDLTSSPKPATSSTEAI